MTLQLRLSKFPKVRLGQYPTPLQPMPRLAAHANGPRLWVKRDDVAGPGLGGSKTRKLEFLFGEAQARQAKVVATFGGLQNNFARQMAAAASAQGMQSHCIYIAARPRRLEGNLLLAKLCGAHLHFIPYGGGSEGGLTVEQASRLVGRLARVTPGCMGRRMYFMPVGGHNARGALGYVAAAVELEVQLRERNVQAATIVMAAGTGGTLAGLMAGLHLQQSQHSLLAIDVGKLWRGFPASIAALATELCGLLGEPHTFRAAEVPLIERTYVGRGYARPTAHGIEALRTTAELEGLVLDPVYTAKAMGGLLDQIRRRRWPATADVVFLHTGGMPALWADSSALIRGNRAG